MHHPTLSPSIWGPMWDILSTGKVQGAQTSGETSHPRESFNDFGPMLLRQSSRPAPLAHALQQALRAPYLTQSRVPPTPPAEEEVAAWLAAFARYAPTAPPNSAPEGDPPEYFHLPTGLVDPEPGIPKGPTTPRRTQLPRRFSAPLWVRRKLGSHADLKIYGPHQRARPAKFSLIFSKKTGTLYLVGNPLFSGASGKICPAMALSLTEPGREDAPIFAFKILHTNHKPRSITGAVTEGQINIETEATHALGDLVDCIDDEAKHRTYIVTDWMPGNVFNQLPDLGADERAHMRHQNARAHITLRAAIVAAQDVHRLHVRNIVHRDVKFDNMVCDANGFIKLGDPGLAAYLGVDGRTAKKHEYVGTLHLMAPEVLRGERVTAAVDAWSLGMSILEGLAGGDSPILDADWDVRTPREHIEACMAACEDFANWRKMLVAGTDAEGHDIIDVARIRPPGDPEATPWDHYLYSAAQEHPQAIAYVLSQLANPSAKRRSAMNLAEKRLQRLLDGLGDAPQGTFEMDTSEEYQKLIERMHEVRIAVELDYGGCSP